MALEGFTNFLKTVYRVLNNAVASVVSFVIFSLSQYLIFLGMFFLLMFFIDYIASGVASLTFLWHFVNLINALIALLISLVTFNPVMIQLSIRAMLAHVVVGISDTILVPIFAVFKIINYIFSLILIDSAFVNGNPASCTAEGYPLFVIGDLRGVHALFQMYDNIFGDLFKFLEQEYGVSYGDVVIIQKKPLYEVFMITPLYNSLDSFRDLVDSIRNQSLIPIWAFDNIMGLVSDVLGALGGEFTGSDLMRHYLFIKRIEFGPDGQPVPGQGSNFFATYIQDRIKDAWGC